MLTKAKIQLIRSLHQKKFRYQHQLFLVEGEKCFEELRTSNYEIESIYAIDGFKVKSRHEITYIHEKQLRQISTLKNPNKVIAVARFKNYKEAPDLSQGTSIALYEINDPGNLGTIIRTAHWYGIKNIICSPNSVDVYSPKVVQASMGSNFYVDVTYAELEETIKSAPNSFATILKGRNINEIPLKEDALLVFGSESHGLPQELSDLCTQKIKIPNKGGAESLNIGVAAAICMDRFTNA